MVARLKLKGIDGRAPPEVNTSHLFVPSKYKGFASKSRPSRRTVVRDKAAASLIHSSGNTIEMRETPKALITKSVSETS